MSTGYLVSLVLVVAVVAGARMLLPAAPLRRVVSPMTLTDAVLSGAGFLGLVFHCAVMFSQSFADALSGASAAVGQINAMGTASIIWYAVPAALVLLGLRRQHPITLAAVLLALAAVAVTMYDGGSLQVHLSAIFVLVVVLAGITVLALPPSRQARAVSHR